MSAELLGPAGMHRINRADEIAARLAKVYRGDGQWLCGLGNDCGFHLKCRENGGDTPQEKCFCHNCDQRRRRSTKRPRWTPGATE